MTKQPPFQAPSDNQDHSEAEIALEKEGHLPLRGWYQEIEHGLEYGLTAASSIKDRTISTFSRGELPHYAGINTFMNAPYLENMRLVGSYDVAIIGAPHDSGTSYRPGARFGPQGIRKISALYTTYNFELGVDLREQITLCDVGDIFTIPANNEKSFDQISQGVAYVFSSGVFPVILGGDHSICFPTIRAICSHLGDKKVGIINFDHHIATQKIDLDERMDTCSWFHATNMANVPAKNLVQMGIGGWQVRRSGLKVSRERASNILTVTDITEMGLNAAADFAIAKATDKTDCVWISFDINCIDAAFVPGNGSPESGGLLPREVLYLLKKIVQNTTVCGIEVVGVSPPYDVSEMTALIATRIICDTLAHLVVSGQLPREERPSYIDDEPQIADAPWN